MKPTILERKLILDNYARLTVEDALYFGKLLNLNGDKSTYKVLMHLRVEPTITLTDTEVNLLYELLAITKEHLCNQNNS
jgi:hypothetical protein